MAGIDKQVRSASAGFADLWERAAPRLAKTHHVKFPGCRMRPVELMEPVALEDVFAGTMRWLQALRDEYTQSKTRLHPKLWTDRQLKDFPSLHEVLHNLNPHPLAPRTEAEWHRRLSHNAERVLAALLGVDARTLHRRRGDYLRLERADLRLAQCEECGTGFFRRRSEPNAPNRCELCHQKQPVGH